MVCKVILIQSGVADIPQFFLWKSAVNLFTDGRKSKPLRSDRGANTCLLCT